jgi:recombination protein RecA
MLDAEAMALMAVINKKYGAGAVILAADMPAVPRFPSGSLGLDLILGGGWPGNQWSEIIGSESSGKTSVAHKTIAASQKANSDFTTLWVAAEGYDHEWAAALGVDTSRVMVLDTNAMEDAYASMLQAAESRAVDAIVLDSYPALIADAEDEKAMDEWTISAGARVTGKFFRKAGKPTKRSLLGTERPLLGLVINQFRDKVGAFSPRGGTPRTTPGGNGKNYAFYTRVEVSRLDWIDEKRPPKGTARVGQKIKFRTLKNKTASPEQVASVDFYFSDTQRGSFRAGDYDTGMEFATLAVFFDVVSATGNGYISHGDRKWRSLDLFASSLRGEIDLQEDIASAVMRTAFGKETV